MNNVLSDFSNLIDQQFDYKEEPVGGFFSFLLSLFR